MANRRVVTIQRTSKDIKLMWLAGKALIWGSFPIAFLAMLLPADDPDAGGEFLFSVLGLGLIIVWCSKVMRWWHHS